VAPPRRPLTQRRAPYHGVVRLHAEHFVYFQKMFGQEVIRKKNVFQKYQIAKISLGTSGFRGFRG
jgi:hypothetical protein